MLAYDVFGYSNFVIVRENVSRLHFCGAALFIFRPGDVQYNLND